MLVSFWMSYMNFYIVELSQVLNGLYLTHPLNTFFCFNCHTSLAWSSLEWFSGYVLTVPPIVNSRGVSHCHMVINCTCSLWAGCGRPCTLMYKYFLWDFQPLGCQPGNEMSCTLNFYTTERAQQEWQKHGKYSHIISTCCLSTSAIYT